MRNIFIFFTIVGLVNGCSHIERRQQMETTQLDVSAETSPMLSKHKVRDLEKGLVTQQDKALYSKLLPWFHSDEEKLSFLRNSDYEEKQKWVIKSKILNRSSELASRYKRLIDSQDIAIGMPNEIVKRSWGDPLNVETSGNVLYKNEKWRYSRTVSTPDGFKQEKRIVYFEGGRVVGWETE
ncbi:MAG: hypothetical protein JNL11_16685 [Bdellovibrionaceae bacterium]|nr:hypothetical protein [Pseudobdellovibrionaceae bacterium]